MTDRNPHGLLLQGTPVVAADTIAKLSAVGGKDVAKVLIAIHALAAATGNTVEEVVRIAAIPTQPADAERFDATEEHFPVILHALGKAPHRHFIQELLLHKRFGAKSSEGNLRATIRSSYPALRVIG